MSEHQYIGSGESDEVELNRLKLLERLFDPTTTRHLEMIGVSKDWKCLEVGAGAGSVAEWLSMRVGPAGKILATDIDVRFLQKLSRPNLEIRKHNIIEDTLEENQYDLVHCRTVLMQLPEPEKAMSQMAKAVRPGGWLIVEENDYGSIVSTDVTNPSAVIFTNTLRTVADFLREKKIVDPYFGRRVRGLIEQRGFTDVVQEGWTCMCRGGEPMAKFDAATIQMASKPLINAGLLSQEQHDRVQLLFQDATFEYPGLTMFSAWGRKPG